MMNFQLIQVILPGYGIYILYLCILRLFFMLSGSLMTSGKCVLLFLGLFIATSASAQRVAISMPDHDDKIYYFGITFGMNYSIYQLNYTSAFASTDTFNRIQPRWRPGFNLGLMGTLRLSGFVDFRFVPSLSFAEKQLQYEFGPPKDSLTTRSIEAINMHLPFQFKFKSDRINNFRFYALVGGKFDYDLAANSRSRRNDEFLKVSPVDYGFELGVGFEFYNPSFIFSPEIKISQGMRNQLFLDRSLPLTNAIQTLLTRMIVISIHLEG